MNPHSKVTYGNKIWHRLKNGNTDITNPKIWRYTHFHSHASFQQKRALLVSCLRKVDKNGKQHDRWIEENLDETELIRLTHVATDAISALAPAWQQLRSMAATESSTESIKAHDINELGAMVYSSYLETARRALHDSVCKPLKKHGICVDPELLENLFPATETDKTLGTT